MKISIRQAYVLDVLLSNTGQGLSGDDIAVFCKEKIGRAHLFAALTDFHDSGWVDFLLEPSHGESGGRPRRVFKLTEKGLIIAKQAQKVVLAANVARDEVGLVFV